MKKIFLGGTAGAGLCALVSDSDFEKVSKYKWHLGPHGYVRTTFPHDSNGKQQKVSLSRMVVNAPDGILVDHRNGDKLDNRRENLRLCNNAENQRNKGKGITNSSGYKGVSWKKRNKRWEAAIKINGKTKYLGQFKDILDAARAYNAAAIELFGEFARINHLCEDDL